MKNTTLTVTFNTEKLDALTFHMGKRDADLQTELNDTMQRLYEKYVPQATREYIDDKVARDVAGRDRPRRPARPERRTSGTAPVSETSAGSESGYRPPVEAPVSRCVGFFVQGWHPCTLAGVLRGVGARVDRKAG